jgi:hypothetical protein
MIMEITSEKTRFTGDESTRGLVLKHLGQGERKRTLTRAVRPITVHVRQKVNQAKNFKFEDRENYRFRKLRKPFFYG